MTVMARRQLLCSCIVLLCVLWTASGRTISACFSSSNKTLDIDCGAGYMVHITQSFYGYDSFNRCRLTTESSETSPRCTVDDQTRYPCVGQRSCSINLPSGQLGINVPACGQRSNYYQVEYTCVLASSVHDICRTDQLTAQSGYIMTPRYPANYDVQGDCKITIVVDPSQKLNLQIIDMDLEIVNKSDCDDLLYFNDKFRSTTLCGPRTNSTYSMLYNYLHIELRSSGNGHSKGFWLYYEATPPLPTPVPPAETVDRSTQLDHSHGDTDPQNLLEPGPNKGSYFSSTTTVANNNQSVGSTVPLTRNVNHSRKQLPFAAIAGGVIGTLSLILVILLVLLFIKWYKERKYSKGEKILEIRNPAFRNSSDFQEVPHTNNGLYC